MCAGIEGSATPETKVIATVGIITAHGCHLLSVLVLYQLTLIVCSARSNVEVSAFASLSASLHVITPGGLFLSAPYAESPFALLNFLGFLWYLKARQSRVYSAEARSVGFMLLSSITFGVATMFRGNGLLSGLVFLYDAIEIVWVFVRTFWTIETEFEFAVNAQRLVTTGLAGMLLAFVASIPQYLAYVQFCLRDFSKVGGRAWCDATVPSIYAWVQREYW